jgi:SAM-dependent methyltransferase
LRTLFSKGRASGGGVLGYNKLCELEDFSDEGLSRYLAEIFPGGFEPGREHRKFWEIAQAARALVEFGAIHDRAEILGVGAGTETTIFWATNHVRRVFATDLYIDPGNWEQVAPTSMLLNPGNHAPGAWNERRLVVQHMDARELHYEDGSFDGVFSSSSIEHFGDEQDVRQALGEIWRVLKPGGIATVTTEYRLRGSSAGLPGTLIFDEDQLQEIVIRPFRWSLVDPLDLTMSLRTLETMTSFSGAVAGTVPLFPHIVLEEGEFLWTSVHIALRKSEP